MLWDAEIERLTNEIRRSLIYYNEQTHGSRVDNVFIMGGGAQIKGMASILKKSFSGLDVLKPFSYLDVNIKSKNGNYFNENQLLFAAAASLALSIPLVQRKKEVIDFLPEEIRKQKVVFQRQLSIIFAAIVIFSVAFLAWLKVYMDNNILSGGISKLDFEAKKSQEVIDALKEQQSQKQEIDDRLQEAQLITKKRVDMQAALSELRRLLPREVTLKSFKMDATSASGSRQPDARGRRPKVVRAYHVAIEAFCMADYEHGLAFADSLMQALNASSNFTNAQLVFAPIEAIKPVISNEEVALTVAQRRNFTLSADVKITN
jgi:Tfp pilus assembly protein PilN